MKRITKDFITLFNVLWYRDFPLTKEHKEIASRAEWTTHIGFCARTASDLLGYFMYFEHGNRTDAVIKDNAENVIANLEWEWYEPRKVEKVNEVRQLHEEKENCQFSVFVTYSDNKFYDDNLNAVKSQWGDSAEPIVLFLVRFNRKGKRIFDTIETHHIQNGRSKKIRSQPALPWHAEGKRWEDWS
ncbi:hypothetical protein I6M34_05475 [Shewanella algae]|uniref:hypothetical protein n=1 Tax=Shewanella algae TaxID=38313 RepID=UPI001AAD51AE|nr:hypothetical protein [Shewanella algae]MBO2602563.1 hypothetical protein [Shewanella algae]